MLDIPNRTYGRSSRKLLSLLHHSDGPVPWEALRASGAWRPEKWLIALIQDGMVAPVFRHHPTQPPAYKLTDNGQQYCWGSSFGKELFVPPQVRKSRR